MRFIALCLITLFFVFPSLAQDDVPPPSGEIAFTQEDEEGIYQIHLMDADGTDIRQITDGDTDAYLPIWSPDGQKIVYMRVIEEVAEDERPPLALWVMDADGGNAVEIDRDRGETFIVNLSQWMSWSPDSERFVYRRYTDQDHPMETIVVRADGSEVEDLTSELGDISQAYFLTNDTLLIADYNADGDSLLEYNLSDGTKTPLVDNGIPVKPSPDGTQLALMDRQQLVVMNLSTEETQVVQDILLGLLPEENNLLVYALYWSPDGSRIAGIMNAYISAEPDADPPRESSSRDLLFAASTDGTEYAAFEVADRIVSLSPDGYYITYSVQDEEGNYQIVISRSDGKDKPQIVATEGQPSQPSWRPVR